MPGEFERGTFTGRTIIWKAGWEIFPRASISWALELTRSALIVSRELAEPIRMGEADPAPPAHNTFLSVLVEQGVLASRFFAECWAPRFIAQGMPPFPQRLWIVSLAVWIVGVSS